jgi:antitoxin component YwqK of YwqJK toxin-antitoxin module
MKMHDHPATSFAPQPGLEHGRELTSDEARLFRKRRRIAAITLAAVVAAVPLVLGVLIWGAAQPDTKRRVWNEGTARVEGYFLGSKRHGPQLTYFQTGQLKERASFAYDQPHGFLERWYYDGTKALEGTWSAGLRDGAWRRYYPGGVLKSEFFYDHGQRIGTWRTWYPSGQIEFEQHFQDDAIHGYDRAWYENGQLASEVVYQRGLLHGEARYFDTDGELISEGAYQRGEKVGRWFRIDDAGVEQVEDHG